MKLIICEKRSLAKNVIEAIGISKIGKNCAENDEYCVTWASGHLLTLKDIKDYKDYEFSKWSHFKEEPFKPLQFQYKMNDKMHEQAIEQYHFIGEMLTKKQWDSVINCGDADREGQIIIDNLLRQFKYFKKTERLWLPEQTVETIRHQLKNLENNDNYKNLQEEGRARTYADWLLGINGTILLTLKSGKILNVGRVLIPIVKKIYDRDKERENFKPQKYYAIESKSPVKISIKKKFNKDELDKAKELLEQLKTTKAIVKNIEKKDKIKQPPKLFSLSTLQSYLSKTQKIDFNSSLEALKNLYYNQYVSYPRTNTEYLAEKEKDKVKSILNKFFEYENYLKTAMKDIDGNLSEVIEFKDTKRVFDDSKIESHSALTPTTKLCLDITGNLNNKEFTDIENIVYTAILTRFIIQFLKEDTILTETVATIDINGEEYKIKGIAIKQQGYLAFDNDSKLENEIPKLEKGQELELDFEIVEKETTMPSKINESSLSNFLKHPFKKEKITTEKETEEDTEELDEDDTEEYKNILAGVEIGTEATRTATIEKAKKIGYITQDKANYSITDLGKYVIETLEKLNINLFKEKSVEFSQMLKKVYKGELTEKEVIEKTYEDLQTMWEVSKNIEIERLVKPEDTRENLGNCPKCGSAVRVSTKNGNTSFYCDNYKECTFKVFNNLRFFGDIIPIDRSKMKTLLEKNGNIVINTSKKERKKVVLRIYEYNGKEYIGLKEKETKDKKNTKNKKIK